MKEKFNSENSLKEAFERFQMPVNNEAFTKFQKSLDEEERKKRVIWWKRFALFFIPFIFVGVFTLYTVNKDNHSEIMATISHNNKSQIPPDNINEIINNPILNGSLNVPHQTASNNEKIDRVTHLDRMILSYYRSWVDDLRNVRVPYLELKLYDFFY